MNKTTFLFAGSMSLVCLLSVNGDFVINDDLIVDGSGCIGFDCVNGESFGFDTLRLKENNLRIAFDDTSVAASYPRNDWQLTANDSANGGASKFSIDDISGGRTPFTVEANAPSHSLYVDDGGRLGLGTSTPATEIHSIDGDTPTLRLAQDGSSGFAPQTWDVAGNETNFFIRDVSNGSTLPFRIRPGAPSSSIFIDDDGSVGFGTASPDDDLHISKSGSARIRLTNSSITDSATNSQSWIMNSNGTFRVSAASTGVVELALDASGNLTILGSLTANGSSFPDYVFGGDYQMMSLYELESFIDENSHLPGLPTQSEVEENGGYNMTHLQLKMLEKIEELTIHTIAQEKLIATQRKEFHSMKAEHEERIAALEAKIEILLD